MKEYKRMREQDIQMEINESYVRGQDINGRDMNGEQKREKKSKTTQASKDQEETRRRK